MWRHLPVRTALGQLFSMCSCVCLLVLHKLQSLERTLFHWNKFALLANWIIITLRTKMKMFCGSILRTFCHWLMELHEHCCEMESMIVFGSLSPFMSCYFIYCFVDQSVFWIFRFVLMKKSDSFDVFRDCSFISVVDF